MKEKVQAPELRFEGFTDDWEERKLGSLTTVVRGASPRPIQDPKWFDKESDIGWLRIADVTEQNGRIYHLEQHISKLGQEKTRVLTEPHLLLSIAATVGKPVVNYVKTGVHDGFLIFLNPTFEREFMFQWLEMFRPKWQKYGQPGSQVNLNSELVRNQEIVLPNYKEQQKIGSFFKQLDDTIVLHQRKLDLLKEQKKGYLQKMFPKNGAKVPELRFEGFADDWEDRKLGDTLTELKSGLSRMLSNNDIGLPVVRANNINDGQFNIDSDVKYWYVNDPQGANTVNYLIRKNDILINFINSEAKMGTATIVENTPIRDTIYTTNILRARLKKEYDSYYWFALTQINQYKINIKIITKPAVNQASFTTVDFKKLNFMFPNLKEQQKIGSFFKQLDNTIALHQRKLDLLKEQKKGFLQKMFV
ncbi:restriction endonuclease subunit S [Lactococcus cremoris]|uniref:restriction endonuclease subunit S n=1 Tax=Lactococcus lactis subsp. cremoris TaxID=1359 RepID=UPI002FCC64D5